jgi:hypothetical protein
MLAGFFGVVRGVVQVALRNMGMVSGLFMSLGPAQACKIDQPTAR